MTPNTPQEGLQKEIEKFMSECRRMTPEERESVNRFFWSQFEDIAQEKTYAGLKSEIDRLKAKLEEARNALIQLSTLGGGRSEGNVIAREALAKLEKL